MSRTVKKAKDWADQDDSPEFLENVEIIRNMFLREPAGTKITVKMILEATLPLERRYYQSGNLKDKLRTEYARRIIRKLRISGTPPLILAGRGKEAGYHRAVTLEEAKDEFRALTRRAKQIEILRDILIRQYNDLVASGRLHIPKYDLEEEKRLLAQGFNFACEEDDFDL